jgi:hypothetical protein
MDFQQISQGKALISSNVGILNSAARWSFFCHPIQLDAHECGMVRLCIVPNGGLFFDVANFPLPLPTLR